jgi:hypothetical protein
MKKVIFLAFILSGLVIGGCLNNAAFKEQIRMKSIEQGSVFEELEDSNLTPGFGVLLIRLTMKTPKEGFYIMESKNSLQGKSEYPFIFNIGGQGVTWLAKGTPDIQQKIVHGRRNPEGGEGVKYFLEKNIRLKAGVYKIYFGLTEENFRKEMVINVTEGKTRILEFKPIYRRNRVRGNIFYGGIHDFEVHLDGKEIKSL